MSQEDLLKQQRIFAGSLIRRYVTLCSMSARRTPANQQLTMRVVQ